MPHFPGHDAVVAPARDAAAWNEELGRLAAGVAHEINNLLNGVSVNLEVVRTRVARKAESSAVGPFAETAGAQLELLTPVIRGLVALARPESTPLSLITELGHIVAVTHAIAGATGGRVQLEPAESEGDVCVSGATARLLLASAVRTAAESGAQVVCSVSREERSGGTVIGIAGAGPALGPETAEAAAAARVQIERHAHAMVLRFPASFPPQPSHT